MWWGQTRGWETYYRACQRHEVWHLKQASIYRKQYGIINEDNYSNYLKYTNRKAKRYIDSFGLNEDNIVQVSRYAYSSYSLSRYDEIEAEIKAFRGENDGLLLSKRNARII